MTDRPPRPTCSEPGCIMGVTARGRCYTHYQRYRIEQVKAGTWQPMTIQEQSAARRASTCTSPGCEAKAAVRGFCNVHYRRHVRAEKTAGTYEPAKQGWIGDPEGHAAAGKKGGGTMAGRPEDLSERGKRGGEAVSQDREHMAELGRSGAAAKHGKNRKAPSE